jgi:signal peptidase I
MMPSILVVSDAAPMHGPRVRAGVQLVQPASKAHDGVLATFRSLLEFVVVAMFALTFILQPFRIPSESMVPTLRVGDFLMVDKQSFEPEGHLAWMLPSSGVHRGDLVVFHFPVDPSMHLVKRVVAVPGDRIRLRGGRVWINDAPLNEPYAFYSPAEMNDFRDNFPSLRETDPSLDPRWWMDLRRSVVGGELTVPRGELFVLGDNRNDSEDSRYWGFVPEADVVGRPFVVYFSIAPETEGAAPETFAAKLRTALRVHLLR